MLKKGLRAKPLISTSDMASKGRQPWTEDEDKLLVDALLELHVSGKFVYADMQPDYVNAVHQLIDPDKQYPKYYFSGNSLRRRMRTIKNEFWEYHSHRSHGQTKRFPHYDNLCTIFVKDATKSSKADSLGVKAKDMVKENQIIPCLEDKELHFSENISSFYGVQESETSKRKRNEGDEVGDNCVESKVANHRSNAVNDTMSKVATQIKDLPGLKLDERLIAMSVIGRSEPLVVMFDQLDEEGKVRMAQMVAVGMRLVNPKIMVCGIRSRKRQVREKAKLHKAIHLSSFSQYNGLEWEPKSLWNSYAFGPEGHRGMSVLIFDASAVGYLEAERLGKHFERQDIGRYAWNDHPVHFNSDGKRQLYGYLATEQDLEAFNLHSPGKLKLKFELVSYQEKVVNQYKQLSKDSQQLIWYKKMIAKQEMTSKSTEDAYRLLFQKLRKIGEETKIIRQRTQMYHEQNAEELDFLEKFTNDQLKVLVDCRNEQKKELEKLQQEECKTVHAVSDVHRRNEKVEKDVKSQTKEMNEVEEKRVRLMKSHEEEMAKMKSKHVKEENEAKEMLDSKLDQLTKRCSQ